MQSTNYIDHNTYMQELGGEIMNFIGSEENIRRFYVTLQRICTHSALKAEHRISLEVIMCSTLLLYSSSELNIFFVSRNWRTLVGNFHPQTEKAVLIQIWPAIKELMMSK